MKKAVHCLALLLLLCAVLCCTACTGLSVSRENDIDEELIVVGFSQVGSESDWRLANTSSMISAFSEENGYRLLFDNAKQRQENIQAVAAIHQQPVAQRQQDHHRGVETELDCHGVAAFFRRFP